MKVKIRLSNRKRKNKHGFLKRNSEKNGRALMARRRRKGRKRLSAQLKNSLSPAEFKYVYGNAKSLVIQEIKYYYKKDPNPKVGFIVSRKYGNAVERNLFKRRCRHIFYELIKNGFSYSIIIQPKTKNNNWNKIKSSFESMNAKLT